MFLEARIIARETWSLDLIKKVPNISYFGKSGRNELLYLGNRESMFLETALLP